MVYKFKNTRRMYCIAVLAFLRTLLYNIVIIMHNMKDKVYTMCTYLCCDTERKG